MKKYLTWSNLLLVLCLLAITVVAIIFSSLMTWIIWICEVFGILTTFFSAKGKWICYIFDLASYALYIYICLIERYYGEMILSFIVIIISIISLIQWKKNQMDDVVEVNWISNKEVVLSYVFSAIALIVYSIILYFLNTSMPILNAIPTICYLLGYYFAARRSMLQFYTFIAYELGFVLIWTITAINGQFDSFIFLIGGICEIVFLIMGLLNWRKLKTKQDLDKENRKKCEKKED